MKEGRNELLRSRQVGNTSQRSGIGLNWLKVMVNPWHSCSHTRCSNINPINYSIKKSNKSDIITQKTSIFLIILYFLTRGVTGKLLQQSPPASIFNTQYRAAQVLSHLQCQRAWTVLWQEVKNILVFQRAPLELPGSLSRLSNATVQGGNMMSPRSWYDSCELRIHLWDTTPGIRFFFP